MASFDKGDFLIVKDEKDRNHLVQAVNVTKGQVQGAIEKDRYIEGRETKYLTVDKERVVLNLGEKPMVGSVYGCRVNPLQTQTESDIGQVWVFRDGVDKKVRKQIVKAINKAWSTMTARGLDGFADELRFEVHPAKGKYAGMYYTFSEKSERFDMVKLMPKELEADVIIDLLYHEFGHGLENRLFTPELSDKWIKLYHSYTEITMATKKQVEQARKDVLEQGSHGVASSVLEEFSASVIEGCVDWIAENHFIDGDRLETLIDQGHDLKELWPTTEIPVSTITSPIGEYSEKNPSEFWCEALRFKLGGHSLPKKIDKLVNKTLKQLAGRKPTVEEDDGDDD
ncbi:hypothetical protein GR11A_00146 [Vibrio phage vB_VcorM_GR11A]|nr:hypothetical protein GR11A_00146 [Vibrio phage vB_VcorM_GR11A]